MLIKLTLPVLPVLLASIVLWFIAGGVYSDLIPEHAAGTDNLGVVFSTLGICLFVVDRVAFLWKSAKAWLIIMQIWLWGILFVGAGLYLWIKGFNGKYWLLFVLHWLVVLGIFGFFFKLLIEYESPEK